MAHGRLDVVDSVAIYGWARNSDERESSILDVRIDGMSIGLVSADRFRHDLNIAKIREGYASFELPIPNRFRDGKAHDISVISTEDGRELQGSPQRRIFDDIIVENGIASRFERLLFQENNLDAAISSFRESLDGRSKVAVFCGYTKTSKLFRYHNLIIDELKRCGFVVIHVHAADLKTASRVELNSSADLVIQKANIGYDFGSWMSGISVLGKKIDVIDELLLINDSNYFPIFPLDEFLGKARDGKFDLYGIMDSYEIGYHIQSYCIYLSSKSIASGLLRELEDNYVIGGDKDEIIFVGEIGLTTMALERDLNVGRMISFEHVRDKWISKFWFYYDDFAKFSLNQSNSPNSGNSIDIRLLDLLAKRDHVLVGHPINPSHFFWRTLYEDFRCPVLKRDLMLKNPMSIPDYPLIGKVISRVSTYDLSVINEMNRSSITIVPFITDEREILAPTTVSEPGPDSLPNPTMTMLVASPRAKPGRLPNGRAVKSASPA